MPLPRGITNIGLMPSGSRASVRASGVLVVEREREHAAEPREGVGPPFAPALQDDFRIRLRDEPDALAAQDGAQLAVVVQLTVVAQVQAILDERLIRTQVDRSMIDRRRCASWTDALGDRS